MRKATVLNWRSDWLAKQRMDSETLNDRLRHLCALAIMTPDTDIGPVLSELRVCLHEHSQMVRTMAVQAFGTRQSMSSIGPQFST